MPDQPVDRSLDVFGVKPISTAVDTATKGAVAGAGAFLSRICLPAAEEFGLFLQDRVKAWRAQNAASVAQKAEKLLDPHDQLHAHPRLVGVVLEQASWMEIEQVQQMWAGLLASSCNADGDDDSNLMFADLLARLSVSQARLLNHICSLAPKKLSVAGLLHAGEIYIQLAELRSITGVSDLHRLDREMDHMRSLELLSEQSGFWLHSQDQAHVTPTTLALQMFARCQGHRGDPALYFGIPVSPPTN
jgi:hypothetical protein